MIRILLWLPFFSLTLSAHSWSGPGHEIVADIAWSEMTTATRQQATALLAHLPGYKELLLSGLPPDLSQEDRDRYVFAKAAKWADMVKSDRRYQLYNHSPWHYVNFPLVSPHDSLTSGPDDSTLATTETDNILEALRDERTNLTAGPDNQTRALALAWLLHLIGDIHQPLHSVAFFSSRFPEGDRGGNDYFVRQEANSRPQGMHQTWDQMFGVRLPFAQMRQLSDDFRSRPEFARSCFTEELKRRDPADWSKESLEHARVAVYLLDGPQPLQGATTAEARANRDSVPVLPSGYMQTGRELARRRVVLAGYRLADVLNESLNQP